jgi:predicted nucleotidyltransferase
MDRDTAIAILKRHEAELRKLGVVSLSLFGSAARDEAADESDIDIAVRLAEGPHGFAYFARLDRIEARLSALLTWRVDIVPEPAPAQRIQTAIERDRCLAF